MVKVLALTLGDRYGVGPELAAAVTAMLPPENSVKVLVVGDRRVFAEGRRIIGLSHDFPVCQSIKALRTGPDHWALLDRPFDAETLPRGRVDAAAGREVLETLAWAIDAALRGEIGGLVYAPLNKQAMRLAGHAAGDELDFLSRHMPAAGLCGEINILGALWTSRVTSHVPLRAVADLITVESVIGSINLLANALRAAGVTAPRVVVAALNPHAGEGGAFGMEEIEIIAPAVARARDTGLNVEGPFPADTLFPRALSGAFDGVVTMFHDQGQIALKLAGLGMGITYLAGLPIPIATPGHGTAFDIAGTGQARPDGLAAAVSLVAKMMPPPAGNIEENGGHARA